MFADDDDDIGVVGMCWRCLFLVAILFAVGDDDDGDDGSDCLVDCSCAMIAVDVVPKCW